MTDQINPSFVCTIDETQQGTMDDDHDEDEDEHLPPLVPRPPDGPINGKTSQVLISALSDELKDMIQEPLTHSNLNQISRFANIAQELIMVRSPIADVRHRKRKRAQILSASANPSYTYNSSANPVIGGSGYPLEENSLTGEFAPNETFGANITRQLVSALSSMKDEKKKGIFEDLVDGIAAAKEKGLDDAVASLQQKLDSLLGPKDDTLKPPPPNPPALEEPKTEATQ